MRGKRELELKHPAEVLNATVVELALDCIVSIDHEGRVIEFNPAAERTFGYKRADVNREADGRADRAPAPPATALRRLYDESDVAIAEDLGQRAGQAIENARLFREVDEQRAQLVEQQTELEAQAAEVEETALELEKTNRSLREKTEDALRATKRFTRTRRNQHSSPR